MDDTGAWWAGADSRRLGQGKSFLVEYLMTVWPHQYGWKCAKLQNTGTITSPRALLTEVMAAFGLEPSNNAREMALRLESWLLAQAYEENQTVVLFVDEAQSIDPSLSRPARPAEPGDARADPPANRSVRAVEYR